MVGTYPVRLVAISLIMMCRKPDRIASGVEYEAKWWSQVPL